MKFEKLKSIVLTLIEKSDIENKDAIESIDFIEYKSKHKKIVMGGKHFKGYGLIVEFKKNKLKSSEEEKFLDDCWRIIYEWLDMPVYLINSSEGLMESFLIEQEKNDSRESRLLHSFMDSHDSEGFCGYFVIEDKKGFQVILLIDRNYVEKQNFVEAKVVDFLKKQIKREIKSWVGLDVYVGSIVKNCDGLS